MALERTSDSFHETSARITWATTSSPPTSAGRLRFIEVKGRIEGADKVIVTKNEILTSLQQARGVHPRARARRRREESGPLRAEAIRS